MQSDSWPLLIIEQRFSVRLRKCVCMRFNLGRNKKHEIVYGQFFHTIYMVHHEMKKMWMIFRYHR